MNNSATNIFFGGLWFGLESPVANEIRKNGFTIVPATGLPTMEERISELVAVIAAHPKAKTLGGHSAGAVVIAHAVMAGVIPERITQIIPMCSGPLPGIGYGLEDKTTWAMMKPRYIGALITGNDYELADEEVESLLSISEHDLEYMRRNLVPDSGKFTREVLMSRFARKPQKGFLWSHDRKIAEIRATDDVIIGSTGSRSSELYDAKVKILINGGHMQPLINFSETLGRLHRHGFVF